MSQFAMGYFLHSRLRRKKYSAIGSLTMKASLYERMGTRAIISIVWSESRCPSLTHWDLEFAVHGNIFPQCAAFGKLDR
jgi:hypothetical protein